VYYPAEFPHTLTTVSDQPANYLMFRWLADSLSRPHNVLGFERFRFCMGQSEGPVDEGFRALRVFDGPTTHLRKLHCHASTLSPGAGYKPHEDDHDVAIVVLEGELSTLGGTAQPCDIILCPAGKPHGMRNKGKEGARYLVFEFHGIRTTAEHSAPGATPSRNGVVIPGRWKQRLLRFLRRKR